MMGWKLLPSTSHIPSTSDFSHHKNTDPFVGNEMNSTKVPKQAALHSLFPAQDVSSRCILMVSYFSAGMRRTDYIFISLKEI